MPKDASCQGSRSSRAEPYRPSRLSRIRPDDAATQSSQGSFFQSSSNVEISGGNFSVARGHHTNLIINVNQVGQDDSESNGLRPTAQGWEESATGEDVNVSPANTRRSGETWRTRALPIQRSCDIYYRHLSVKGRGSPLWIPEPNNELPVPYRRRGVTIGDVGIITASGSFDFLFNICVPRDDPINPENLPEDFFPLNPPLRPIDLRGQSEFMPNSYLASASIQRLHYDGNPSGLTFECSASEGAILTMPDGAYSRDLANVARFRRYLAANVERWYRYINGDLGREAKNGDVRLVIGCDKTSTWGMATFSDLTEQQDLQLKFRPTGESNVGPTYGWEYSGMAEVRVGPSHQEVANLELPNDDWADRYRHPNQCVFVRTLNATLRQDVWDRLSSEFDDEVAYTPNGPNIGFRDPSPSSRSQISRDNSTYFSGSSSKNPQAPMLEDMKLLKTTVQRVQTSNIVTGLTAHPSYELNQVIMEMFKNEYPSARMVITEDADWISGLREGDSTVPPAASLLARVLVSNVLDVCEDEGFIYFREKYQMHTASTSFSDFVDLQAPNYPAGETVSLRPKGIQKATSSDRKICCSCKDTLSVEWLPGPLGPKTLCATCGRAYGRLTKFQPIEVQRQPSEDYELEDELSARRLEAIKKGRQRSPFES
ncbi:hypothetical protein GALMADRAFT_270676 [Galerina marginata CBS 339.88]|uniref:GATA-type domain-containing protein n=1 Tax=Galerina marginata (strain CBS 339.88) TaxID=685588 RepID=A0A067T128_GALM3|nr:hypothetical protein GALMADRAFT_270676 [Galerina marginata CBS 339.88]